MKRLTLPQIRTAVLGVSLILVGFFVGLKTGQSGRINPAALFVDRAQPQSKQQYDMNLFWQVWDKLNESYLIKDNLKPQKMIEGAIKGMTQSLGDPYTVFLPAEENKESKEELNGSFEGVGIQLGFKNEQLAVMAPLEGMPAKAAGILAGDYILHIKDAKKNIDQDTAGLSLPEAVKLIRGDKGSEVELTILREGWKETKVFKIKRDMIVVKSVELEWVGNNKNIAHLKLTRFGGRTDAEWQEAVGQIKKHGASSVILDLRNNPGGYLQGAVNLAGEFLSSGKVVVQQADAQGSKETYSIDRNGRLLTEPLVVLVNEGSASSSEILAGALRDYDRARLVGEKTFGKGTVQEALDIGDDAGLHVTTAKWLLPKGAWVNDTKGLTPDVEIKDNPDTETDEQLAKAIEVLK